MNSLAKTLLCALSLIATTAMTATDTPSNQPAITQNITLDVVGVVTTLDGTQMQQSELQSMQMFPTLSSDLNAVSRIKTVIQTTEQKLELYDAGNVLLGEIDISMEPNTLSGMDDSISPKFLTFASSPMTQGQTTATSATLQFDFDECTAPAGIVRTPDLVKGEPPPTAEQQEEDQENAEPQECRALVVILALQPATISTPAQP